MLVYYCELAMTLKLALPILNSHDVGSTHHHQRSLVTALIPLFLWHTRQQTSKQMAVTGSGR
jgi:hypothetical protein